MNDVSRVLRLIRGQAAIRFSLLLSLAPLVGSPRLYWRIPERHGSVSDATDSKANGLEPHAYLSRLFERPPHMKTVAGYEAMLPWNIKPSSPPIAQHTDVPRTRLPERLR